MVMASTSAERVQAPAVFAFREQGAHAAIVHDGREIMRFESHFLQWGVGNWSALDQCMVPGEGPEVCSLPVFGFFGGLDDPVTEVSYAVQSAENWLAVTITPRCRRSGKPLPTAVQEACTFTVTLEDGRYRWEQRLVAEFREDLHLQALPESLHLFKFPHQDNQPGVFWQFADPAPTNGSGPSVPMTRDWQFQPEPYNGPDSFRQHWQRRYTDIIMQNPDGSFSWSALSKTKWLFLTQDNRRARPCHPQGLLYLVQPDGRALEYRCDAPSHYHHVCEWGMDYHFWCDLAPFAKNEIIPAGTRLEATTTVRLVDAEEVQPVRTQAVEMTLTPEEFAKANRPLYEEPENTFTTSVLDTLSPLYWEPTSEGCRWERSGGYQPGTGCLVIHNDYTNEAAWEQRSVGPQQWANPFLPGKRYRLSAWVRAEDCTYDPSDGGPQVGVDFIQSNGPGMVSQRVRVEGGWSPSFFGGEKPIVDRIDWTYVEVVTPPCPSYVFYAHLKLRFTGRGIAYFSNVRWEMVDEVE